MPRSNRFLGALIGANPLRGDSADRTTSNLGMLSLSLAGTEANGDRDLTQLRWGGMVGRDVVVENTNLLSHSTPGTGGGWVGIRATFTTNTTETTAPDGTGTATKAVETSATGTHRADYQNIVLVDGDPYTYSIFAKAAEHSRIQFEIGDSGVNTPSATYDLSSGQVVAESGAVTSDIQNAGNGWFRCILSHNAGTTDRLVLRFFTSGVSYAGDGSSGVYLWGAQLEEGSLVSAFIPTSGRSESANSLTSTGVVSLSEAFMASFQKAVIPTDPYWSNVALLVHGDTLTDLSSYSHALTANNRISVQTSPTPPFGTSSIEINNASNALFTTGNLSSPAIGTGDFTIEYTVYQDNLANWHTHFGSRNGTNSSYLQQASNKFNIGTTGSGDLFVHRGQGSNTSISAGGFTTLTWHHIVVVRNNGVWGVWRNGTRQVRNTGFGSANYSSNTWGIGTGATGYAGRERLRGHIMNLRFTVGVARYDPDDTTIPTPTELFPTG